MSDQINNSHQTDPHAVQELEKANRQVRSQCEQLKIRNPTLEKQYKSFKYSISYSAIVKKLRRIFLKCKSWLDEHIVFIFCSNHPITIKNKRPSYIYHQFDKKLLTNEYKKIRTACIMDKFTFDSFESECDLIPIFPENWKEELDKKQPHMLFVESAWHGNNNAWDKKISNVSKEIKSVIKRCNDRNIPTIFWNKEDPVHFLTFLNTASLFDFIFTTDVDCIQRYKALLKRDRVYLLPFACQQKRHNPIEKYVRANKFCFAGSHPVRYTERQTNFQDFFEVLSQLEGGVDIFARHTILSQYTFPDKYEKNIKKSISYDNIDVAYKGYRYAINMNSVKQSQTMFARRVFEVLGSNTLTVSNYAHALRLFFGDLVVSTDDKTELKKRTQYWLTNKLHASKIRLAALRKVLIEHTYHERLKRVIQLVFKTQLLNVKPSVLMVGLAKSDAELKSLISHYKNQIYNGKALLIVATYNSTLYEKYTEFPIKILNAQQAKELHFEQLLDFDYVAGIVSIDYYGPNYLVDLILTKKYSDCVAYGKAAYFLYDNTQIVLLNEKQQYQYVQELPRRSSMIKTNIIEGKISVYTWLEVLPTATFKHPKLLSIDCFNYCCINNVSLNITPAITEYVNDIPHLNKGICIDDIYKYSDNIEDIFAHDYFHQSNYNQVESKEFSAKQLYKIFKNHKEENVFIKYIDNTFRIESSLPDKTYCYLYTDKLYQPNECFFEEKMIGYLESKTGFNIRFVYFFLDSCNKKIATCMLRPNSPSEFTLPKNTCSVKIALRIIGSGKIELKKLSIQKAIFREKYFINRSNILVITNDYPTYKNPHRNVFLHNFVRSYLKENHLCDVFSLNYKQEKRFYEFENIDVYLGNKNMLQEIILKKNYHCFCIHFFDKEIWRIIKKSIKEITVLIWIHSLEIKNMMNSKESIKLLKAIFLLRHNNIKFIFMSHTLAEKVMRDVGVTLEKKQYCIVSY